MSTPTLIPSTTCTVLREARHIKRVHPPTATDLDGFQLACLTDLLHLHGIAIPRLLAYVSRPERVLGRSRLITYWEDLGVGGDTCWESAGRTLKKLHSIPLDSAARLNLPYLESENTYARLFSSLRPVDPSEAKLIDMLRRAVDEALRTLPSGTSVCLVHDDFWEKNLVTDGQGATWLLDWENASLASPAWDLAFVVRAFHLQRIDQAKLDAFERGYGSSLPDLPTAQLYGTLHRVRWVITLIARARMGEAHAIAQLEEEAPLWASGSPA